MPPLSIDPSALNSARTSGYSDGEIADFLSQRAPDQFKTARQAGYSDAQILAHLSGDDNKPSGANFDVPSARKAGYSDTEILEHIHAADPNKFDLKGARAAGYSDKEILAHLTGEDSKPSGIIAGAREGVGNVIHGISETVKQYAGADTSRGEAAAEVVKPQDYNGTNVIPRDTWYDPRTYNYSQIPQAVAEAAPGVMADLAAARAAAKLTKSPLVGAGAGVASYLLRTRGDTAKTDAVIRTGDPNAEPETQDKLRSLATGTAEAIPQAVGIGRFLPGTARVTGVGLTGVTQALAKALKTSGIEAGTGAASNAIEQAGATLGTDKGLTIDPAQVGSTAITSGVTGGLMGTRGLVADTIGSAKLAKFGGDNQAAASALANRISKAADGRALNPTNSFEAVRTADGAVRDELSTAIKPLKGTLDTDTADALKRATKGRTLTDSDLESIGANTPPDVAFLARQAHVASLLKQQGDFGDGKFVGGLTNATGKYVRALNGPVGYGLASALGGAAVTTPYTLPGAATLAGGYVGLRGLDALSGSRSPANRFVNRFVDPSIAPRLPATPQVAPQAASAWAQSALQRLASNNSGRAPAGTAAAATPVSPTGPKVPFDPGVANGGMLLATGQSPWKAPPEAPKQPSPADLNEQVKGALLMAAARRKAAEPVQDPSAANADIQGMLRMAAARRQVAAQQAAAPQATPGLDVSGLNEQVKGALLMAGARRKAASQPAPQATTPTGTPVDPMEPRVSPPERLARAASAGHAEEQPQQAKAQADKVEEVPVPDTLLHTEVSPADRAIARKATDDFSRAVPAVSPLRAQRYFDSTAQRQARIRDRLLQISGDDAFPADDDRLGELLDALRNTRSREAVAAHVDTIAKQYPSLSRLLRSYFGPRWAESVWNASRK